MFAESARVIGFGAGALDVYRPIGQTGDDFTPGAKVGWTDQDQLTLDELMHNPNIERHVGGNVVNALAWLACRGNIGPDISFASVVGVTDPSTRAIQEHLKRIEIKDISISDPEHLPSVSLIERDDIGSDRMVRGRPRTPLDTHMSEEYIARSSADADLVLVASLKSAPLAETVFENTPKDAFVSYNPGSSEFSNPRPLIDIMRQRNPQLLSLNETELRQLFEAPGNADVFSLAAAACEFAENVLCTLGAQGVLLARRGTGSQPQIYSTPAKRLPAEDVVDTLGAGDRANAIATHGLFLQLKPRVILNRVIDGTASVIGQTGAHGDLY